ncbi:MAG: DUF2235 domain-containing protein [Acidobacteriota bacterium]
MPKRIVFCADGTWDDPNSDSNVCQLYNAIENLPGAQVPMYDSGVGANGLGLDKWLGGGLGAGLFQKIKDGYSAIAGHYQPGDLIFLFGFSRGAYTARSLAGMISICGLPTKYQTDSKCLDVAFEAYRNAAHRDELLAMLNETYVMDAPVIQMVGVWDTVGALGIPAIFGEIDPVQYGFLSTDLHPDVRNAAQALTIDEQRLQFQPAIWSTGSSLTQSVTQAWFAGVHCDVGGGYPADDGGVSLANIPLRWMAGLAAAQGAVFKPGFLPATASASDALATLHESRTGAYRIFPAHIRAIEVTASLASSVEVRMRNAGSGYAPSNLHSTGGQLASTYEIVNMDAPSGGLGGQEEGTQSAV